MDQDLDQIRKQWQFQKRDVDLTVIVDIMKDFGGKNGNLKLIDDVKFDGDTVTVEIPKWVVEVREYLDREYGKSWEIIFKFCFMELGIVKED